MKTPFDERFYVGDPGDQCQIVKNPIRVAKVLSTARLKGLQQSTMHFLHSTSCASYVDRPDLRSDEVPIRPF
jgi:hypothetical protein